MFWFTMYYFRRLYILFFTLALNIFFFSTANVNAKSFEINNIEISKPFKNNFNKNTVIDIGFKEAFLQLINMLVKSSDFPKIGKIKLNELSSMIDTFSIKEEKFIDETYYVNLGVSFNKKKIFRYLEKKNIFPSQIIKENFLFIPIIIDENIDDLKIFANNQIYNSWNNIIKEYHLIKYILPTEDLEDINLIKSNYDIIENYDFKEIIKKYYLNNCIVALIFKSEQEVRVLSKIITKNKNIIKNDTFPDNDLGNDEKIEFLINKLKVTYEDTWKEYNQINTSIKLPLMIRVNHENSNSLIKFEKTLDQLDLVNYYSIEKLNKKYTFYRIIYNGSSTNFINVMKNKSYIFNTQKKIWILNE
jgi:hypothetical protein